MPSFFNGKPGRKRSGFFYLILLLFSVDAPAGTLEVAHIDVSREGPRYRVTMDVRFTASPQAVFRVMTRYRDLPRINPAVQRSELHSRDNGVARLHTITRICVVLLCHTLVQLQDIIEQADAQPALLHARVLPEHSNLRYGEALWRFSPCGSGTCMRFESEIEPAFRVPPLIGPWLIQRAMRNEAQVTSEGIERLAKELDSRDI